MTVFQSAIPAGPADHQDPEMCRRDSDPSHPRNKLFISLSPCGEIRTIPQGRKKHFFSSAVGLHRTLPPPHTHTPESLHLNTAKEENSSLCFESGFQDLS